MGLLDRYRNPFQQVDPRTGQPILYNQQPQQDMPWGDGQAFANMYAPRPQPAARPQPMPAIRPMGPAYTPAPVRPMGPPNAPQLPSMGMAEVGPTDASFAAYNPSAAQSLAKEKQPQPGDKATGTGPADQNQYALGGILGNINNSDLLTLGLSMLGQSQSGGDWGDVAKDLQGIQQGAMAREDRALSQEDRAREIKRQEEADKRTAELYGYQVDELKAGQEERAYAKQNRERLVGVQRSLVETTSDPALKAAIQAMQPEQFGEFLGNRILREEDTKAQLAAAQAQRDFQSAEGDKDRRAQAELARLNAELNPRRDPQDTIQYRADVARATPWIAAADQARTYTLGRISRMKDIISELARRGGVNNPLDSDFRIELSRLTGSARENQALLEEYKNLATGFTLDEVQKLKPASNLDLEVISKTLPNPNNNPRAALGMLDRMERELNSGIKTADAMASWLDAGNSLSGKNKEGKTFREVYGLDFTAPSSTAEAANPAPRVGEIRNVDGDDYLFVGGDPNDPKNWQKRTKTSTQLNNGIIR